MLGDPQRVSVCMHMHDAGHSSLCRQLTEKANHIHRVSNNSHFDFLIITSANEERI